MHDETLTLPNGLHARIADETRHYYGGYYHVRLAVTAEIALDAAMFGDEDDYRRAAELLGSRVAFSRTLERMAVPEHELPQVRQELLDAFNRTTLPYLSGAAFPAQFVLVEYKKALEAGRSRGRRYEDISAHH